jgi:hypothetical protein
MGTAAAFIVAQDLAATPDLVGPVWVHASQRRGILGYGKRTDTTSQPNATYGLYLHMLSREGLLNPVPAPLIDYEYVFSWLRGETFIGQDGVGGGKRLHVEHNP